MPRNAISRRDPARRARALKRWVASILVLPALFVFGIVNASSAAAQWRQRAEQAAGQSSLPPTGTPANVQEEQLDEDRLPPLREET